MTESTENNDARRNGLIEAGGGVVIIVLALLVPHWLSDTVAKCNTVIGGMYADQHAKTGAACTAANFLTDFRWVFLLLGVAMIVVGGFTVARANPKFREFLDED